jgi:hypothetical protein
MTRSADDDLGFLGRWARRKADVRSGKVEPDAAAPATLPPVPKPRQAVSKPPGESQRLAERASPTAPPLHLSDAEAAHPAHPAPVLASGTGATDARHSTDGKSAEPLAPPPTLADVEALAADAPDFSRFVSRGVAPDVHRAALKKLFADPHFNVMDGLDIYIDDYGKPDPLPEGMLRQLTQGRSLGLFPDEPESPEAVSAERPVVADETHPTPPTIETPTEAADLAAAPVADTTGESPDASVAPDADTAAPTHEDPDLQLQQQPAAGHPSVDAGAGAPPVRRV